MRIVPAQPHGALREVIPGVHLVQGTMGIGPARLSRNMVVVEREGDLVLVNAVRLDEQGLEALDRLGRVTDVVRLAAGHGCDDPFYKARYSAKVWDVEGQRYFEGVRWDRGRTYFRSDRGLVDGEVAALPGARLIRLGTQPPEGLLLLPHAGGTLVSGDAFQNWREGRSHFNLFGRLAFWALGFVGPHQLGKGWLDGCNPDPQTLRSVLDLGFENLLPAHGDAVLGGAADCWRPAVEAWARRYRMPEDAGRGTHGP